MFYTYAHYTPQGRLFYIGKGQRGRAFSFYQRGSHWNNVVAKYGKPEAQILAHWETEKEALDHEVLLIDCFKSMGYELCNKTNGGEGTSGFKRTTPVWNKGVPLTEECKQKLSAAMTGRTSWNKGISPSEESRKKMSESRIGKPATWNIGRKHSEEIKRKCGAKNVGKNLTEEHKQKITKSLLGNKYAVGNTNRLKYKIIGTNMQTGEQIEFLGAKAVNDAGFQHANVIKCIYGERKSHKGYTWFKQLLENK